MKTSLSLVEPKSINARLFFLLLFIYQVFFTFQGLDLSDEGFFCTFYQEIFHHPDTVQYNFMFWFSGVVGGAFNLLFSDLGVWGLRLFSAITTTTTIILTYHLLKKYLNAGSLQIGLLIVTLVMNNNTKVFHYNYLSVLFYVITATLLVKGLQRNKPSHFILAGFIIALDTFTRLPSVVNIGLVLAIFYYGYLHKNSFKKQFAQAILFGSGFLTGIAITLLIMKMSGHLTIFLNAVELVGRMGSGGDESAYGFMKLIKQFIDAYYASVKTTVIVLVAVLLAAIALNYSKKLSFYRSWMAEAVKVVIIAGLIVLIAKGVIDNFSVLYFLTGLSLMAGVLIIFSKNYNKDIKLLMFIGCYILLSYPLGSGAGLYSVGIYSLWLAFPVAVDYLSKIRFVTRRFAVVTSETDQPNVLVEKKQITGIIRISWLVCIIVGLYYSWYYPFFDYHERTQMTSQVHSKYFRGIFTTKERATVMTELLDESAKYIKPGDYVLAYHSIPMFHYATRSVPFMHNSMPWFYPAQVFREELDSAVQHLHILPVVVMQKRKTVGVAGSGWPDPPPYYDTAWYKKNAPRDSTLNTFLDSNHYAKAWENEMFMIMVPPKERDRD